MWLGDGEVPVGTTITLSGPNGEDRGSAVIVAERAIKDIDEGTPLIDPRTLQLVIHAGHDYHGMCYIDYLDGTGLLGCCSPTEVYPVIELRPAATAA